MSSFHDHTKTNEGLNIDVRQGKGHVATNALVVGAPFFLEVQGVPKKGTNRMLLEPRCTGSITRSRHPLGLENVFLLSRIKRSQDISMGKFGPTALNFGYV